MTVLLIPRATEKAYAASLTTNTYTFSVPTGVNKRQIKDAVEAQFNVTVTGVKTLVQSGKAIRFSKGKNRYPGTTHRSDSKKAFVTLAEGDSIQIFDTPEEETK